MISEKVKVFGMLNRFGGYFMLMDVFLLLVVIYFVIEMVK